MMQERDLMGMWTWYYTSATGAGKTILTFSPPHKYTKYDETCSFGVSPMGSATASQNSTEHGTFRLLDDDRIELTSTTYGSRSVQNIKLENGVLTVGYTPYTR
jgi:hypothetical protein